MQQHKWSGSSCINRKRRIPQIWWHVVFIFRVVWLTSDCEGVLYTGSSADGPCDPKLEGALDWYHCYLMTIFWLWGLFLLSDMLNAISPSFHMSFFLRLFFPHWVFLQYKTCEWVWVVPLNHECAVSVSLKFLQSSLLDPVKSTSKKLVLFSFLVSLSCRLRTSRKVSLCKKTTRVAGARA